MKHAVLLLALLCSTPATAQDDHLAEAAGVRVVHAWTPATEDGVALVFMEIENASGAEVVLTGAQADDAEAADVVGFSYGDGAEAWTPLPRLPIGAGDRLVLAPEVMAIRLGGLRAPLVEGDVIEIDLGFGELIVAVPVAIEAEGATAHSHAGHAH